MKKLIFILFAFCTISASAQWNAEPMYRTNQSPALSKDSTFVIKAHSAVDALNGQGILYPASSSGSTPGIDDVLAVGQALTGSRLIDGDGNNLTFIRTGSNRIALSTTGVTIGDSEISGFGNVLNVFDDTNTAYYDNTAHTGFFGINTSSPTVALDILGSIHSFGDDATFEVGSVQFGGTGARTFSSGSGLELLGDMDNNLGNGTILGINTNDNYAYFDASSHDIKVGINTPSPTAELHVNGTVRFEGYGAGAITSDANGNLTSVSDIRLKNAERSYDVGLNEILKVNPIVYKWNDKSGMEQEHEYAGFSAQNVNKALGDLATGQNKDGYMSLQDRAILAALVNSVKELKAENDEMKKEIKRLKNKIK